MRTLSLALCIAAACTSSPPDGTIATSTADASPRTAPPAVAPPWGLDTVELPVGMKPIDGVFDRFPEDLLGQSRVRLQVPHGTGLSYGVSEPASIVAVTIAAFSDGAEVTVAGLFASSPDGVLGAVEVADRDPSDGLLWMLERGDGGSAIIVWGEPGSSWMFFVLAPDAPAREQLVRAFVEVAR